MRRQQFRSLVAVTAAVGLAAAGASVASMASAATAGCRVTYTISSQWQGGFGATVAITNLGDPITAWTLTWSYANGQTVAQAWNATVTQRGPAVSATNVSYNGALATNGSASFGFNGSWTATNPVPTAFTLNNVACTGGTTAPTTGSSPTRPASPSPSVSPTPTGGGTGPALKTVRVFWLKPTDVAFDKRYPDGIAGVMREAQRYYKQELGKTFTLNSTVVEVVNGEHDKQWYITTNCGGSDHYWCVVENMQAELMRRFGISGQDGRWLCVGEISAEEAGKSGGGGGPGWVILSGHDADGGAGLNGAMNRWYGGMVHELGHGFGLPDATSTDGTPMSASFYGYPDTHFSQAQKNAILAGPYGSFLS
ncbi:cellulose binding domain-containing protein [Dactylosporangium vinaceum]|uniref:Cellulose-binding domain-containing protein n=1 Tax=Dactylosporangium vinaceum TaxID=53362 RepID=A0ABV5MDP6_9ACTN|nr:cellulose-binding domain-containing protein [Dactylosporangium vinaceum]UAC01106.1 cellulose binding domain-containing protein [Dactylosporangium vinaceum]